MNLIKLSIILIPQKIDNLSVKYCQITLSNYLIIYYYQNVRRPRNT